MTEIFFKIRNAASRENRPGRLVDVSIDVHCGECLALSGHTFSGIKELYAILTKNSEYKGNILLRMAGNCGNAVPATRPERCTSISG